MSRLHKLLPGSALSLLFFLGLAALSSDHDESSPPSRCSLALRVNTGQDFVFHAFDEAERRKVDYRVVVQNVAARGDVTLALVGFRLPAEDTPLAEAEAHGATFTLSGEGRVKRIARDPTVPAEFETHLRLVFGSGLHGRPLEEKQVYRLAPLLAPTADSEPIHLRFEGLVAQEDQALARFIVVKGHDVAPARGQTAPEAPRALRVVDTAGAASSTRTTPAPASVPAFRRKWTAVGEVTYRVADGVLESARLNSHSTDRQPKERELAKFSIRRIGRAGKTPPGAGTSALADPSRPVGTR